MSALYLTLKGIPRVAPPDGDEIFFWPDSQGAWRPNKGDRSAEIEDECLYIHDGFAASIFGDLATFHAILPMAPDFVFTAGLTSESPMSRLDFERERRQLADAAVINKLLYLADCRKLVAGIQECAKEVVFLRGEFYRALNLEPLFYPPVTAPDGVRWNTSPVVTKIHAFLGFIFIRLYSLLDYTTKLAIEAGWPKTDFSSYPILSSRNVLFGKRKHISVDVDGTLFERNAVVTEVELYRNQIIHSGFLDDLPKVYEVIKAGEAIEKFILMPDRGAGGHLERSVNRSFFYSREDKINLRLPTLVAAFQERQVLTLKRIRSLLPDGAP